MATIDQLAFGLLAASTIQILFVLVTHYFVG